MPSSPLSIYWDSCVFLSYVEGDADRLPVLDALFDQAGRTREIRILTSTVSIAEVAFVQAERANRVSNPQVAADLDNLWDNRAVLTLVEFHTLIARDARDLIRDAMGKGWTLKPADAIHLATARRVDAAEFQTYDQALFRYAEILKVPINEPRVQQPRLMP